MATLPHSAKTHALPDRSGGDLGAIHRHTIHRHTIDLDQLGGHRQHEVAEGTGDPFQLPDPAIEQQQMAINAGDAIAEITILPMEALQQIGIATGEFSLDGLQPGLSPQQSMLFPQQQLLNVLLAEGHQTGGFVARTLEAVFRPAAAAGNCAP